VSVEGFGQCGRGGVLDGEKGAVCVVRALRFNTMRGEVALQAAETVEAVVTQALDPQAQRELLAGASLVPGEDGGCGFEERVASDDTLFVIVRTPDDPTGLPLAQIRVEVSNLPFDFDIGTREMIGSPDRFLHADKVIVSARISRSGRGLAQKGDFVGQSAVVQPWANDVRVTIDKEVR